MLRFLFHAQFLLQLNILGGQNTGLNKLMLLPDGGSNYCIDMLVQHYLRVAWHVLLSTHG